jgi:hypothetical protein
MQRWLFWTICGLIVVVGTGATILFAAEGRPDSYYRAAPILGSLLVAVGWMVTSLNAITNAETEHTLNLISQRAANAESKSRRDKIYKCFPNDDDVLPLPGESREYPKDDEIYDVVFNEINTSEYIALGALRGVYDNQMLRNEVESSFLKLNTLGKRYIPYIRETFNDAEIWEYFTELCDKWANERKKHPGLAGLRGSFVLAYRAGYAIGLGLGYVNRVDEEQQKHNGVGDP